jgi:hypothetical protein
MLEGDLDRILADTGDGRREILREIREMLGFVSCERVGI